MRADSPPRRARVVGYGLVLALALTVAVDAEPWPLSSFRLFSQVRTGRVVSWQLAVVTPDLIEVPIDVADVPPQLGGAHDQLPRLVDAPDAEVLATVAPWIAAAAPTTEVMAVRIYRTVGRVATGEGDPPAPARRLVREVEG